MPKKTNGEMEQIAERYRAGNYSRERGQMDEEYEPIQQSEDRRALAMWAANRLASGVVKRGRRKMRAAVQIVEWALSCRRENTDEWMEGFVETINAWAEAGGDSDRVEYSRRSGVLRVVKGGR